MGTHAYIHSQTLQFHPVHDSDWMNEVHLQPKNCYIAIQHIHSEKTKKKNNNNKCLVELFLKVN